MIIETDTDARPDVRQTDTAGRWPRPRRPGGMTVDTRPNTTHGHGSFGIAIGHESRSSSAGRLYILRHVRGRVAVGHAPHGFTGTHPVRPACAPAPEPVKIQCSSIVGTRQTLATARRNSNQSNPYGTHPFSGQHAADLGSFATLIPKTECWAPPRHCRRRCPPGRGASRRCTTTRRRCRSPPT